MGHLRDVPKEYDYEAECLLTHPLLLLKEDVQSIMSTADKAVLEKTNDRLSSAPHVSFAHKTTTDTETNSMPQRAKQQVYTPLVHWRAVIGDHGNRYAKPDSKGPAVQTAVRNDIS